MPKWEDGVQSGTRAGQPTLDTKQVGVLYFVSDEDVLERWGGSSWSQVAINAGGVDSGTSFPGGPSTDDQFYRTDLVGLYYWNGTYWLTVQLFAFQPMVTGTAASSSDVDPRFRIQSPGDIFLVDIRLTTYWAVTATGANHWDMILKGVKPDNTLDTIQTMITTETGGDPGTVLTWNRYTTTLDLFWDQSVYPLLRIVYDEQGSAGNFYDYWVMRYREVAT